MAAAGPLSIPVLRKAGCLEACINLVGTSAALDSRTAQLSTMLLRDFAGWDADSR